MNKILFLSIVLSINIIAQSVEFYGKAEQGGLLFGFAENIKNIRLNSNKIPFDKEGHFVIGFDRNDTSLYTLIVEMKEKTFIKKIIPVKGKFNIQRINRLKQKYVSPPKEIEERIKRERKISKAAKNKIGEVKEALFKEGFIRPIKGGIVTGIFGSQRILNGIPKNVHNGLDIAVPTGTPIKAMADGKVLLSADNFFYAGNYIIIDHGLGLNSMYLHLVESLVEEGQFVKKGEVIGKVGTTGRSTGPHLHWTVQWFNKRVNPITVFNYKNITPKNGVI